jgi:hypothetical protein
VAASRNYVCVRPQTYESATETEFLKSLFRGRNGELENTVFCVLASDGKTKLSRSGRSPSMVFDGADELVEFLDDEFKPYASKAKPIERLPLLDEFALALNVASCDGLPLVILRAKSAKDLAELERQVAAAAWSTPHLGQQHFYAFAGSLTKAAAKDAGFAKVGETPVSIEFKCDYGVTVVDPGPFGLTPKTLLHASASSDVEKLREALTRALKAHAPAEKSRREHGRAARREGITWDSEMPVTDGPRSGKRR